jgi:hypothetical protein
VKYVILIYHNPAAWDALSDAQRREIGRRHLALTEELAASGELVVSQALADPSLARTVPAPGPGTVVSDGPYAEAKEYLAGFYLVECESLDRAARYAGRLPHGPQYRIEVRPVMNLKALLEQA